MKILYLTYYFEPDLSAGSFRNTALVNELAAQLGRHDEIHVFAAQPNRYRSYQQTAADCEERSTAHGCRITINRIPVAAHASGLLDQVRCFITYYRAVCRLTKDREPYQLVVASSSRLFTAFLGARLARRKPSGNPRIPLFLDIRDLFRQNILEMLRHRSVYVQPVRMALTPVLWAVEQYTFRSAKHINLVSEGFRSYFQSFTQATYSYCTNGIDEEFLTVPASEPGSHRYPRTVLYAGNIGEGQGLHKIIPRAAQQLGDAYRFVVIGDGGAKTKLKQAIQTKGVTNVELRNPVNRTELLAEYQTADYLFVHLNDFEAFKRVLPSKLFECGATDKPIVAGVAGYAAQFVREHVSNHILLEPGDVTSLVQQLRQTPYKTQLRPEFTQRFQRKTITRKLAQYVLQLVGN
ncbi:glycosyltransferase family 4 protein [Spirosoma fluminis]